MGCALKTRACCSDEAPDACGFRSYFRDGSSIDGGIIHSNISLAGLETDVDFAGILWTYSWASHLPYDGTLGLAYNVTNCLPTCMEPVFDNLVRTGKVAHDKFGVCLGKTNGSLTLGGSNADQYTGEFKYSPMVHGATKKFYGASMTSMMVNDFALNLTNFKNATLDKSTGLLSIKSTAYTTLKKAFQDNFCEVPYLCPGNNSIPENNVAGSISTSMFMEIDRTEEETMHWSAYDDGSWFAPHKCVVLEDKYMKLLPNITIKLSGGAELTMSPYDYMVEHTKKYYNLVNPISYRCLGIVPLPGNEYDWETDAVLGNLLFQKYYVEYDRENDRIGFAKSKNCDLSISSSPVQRVSNMRMFRATTNSREFKCGKGILILILIPLVLYSGYRFTKRSDYTSI